MKIGYLKKLNLNLECYALLKQLLADESIQQIAEIIDAKMEHSVCIRDLAEIIVLDSEHVIQVNEELKKYEQKEQLQLLYWAVLFLLKTSKFPAAVNYLNSYLDDQHNNSLGFLKSHCEHYLQVIETIYQKKAN